ncbi:MAG: alpha/beta hydrolase [Pseudomonadota bacterium]
MSCWVLLRGLMREQRHWGDFPALLAQALPGAQVLTPDLPGNGVRWRAPSATRVADMVESCRAELRARGHSRPCNVLALSLGGMVAVEWGARYPGEIERSVLINTSMRPFSSFHQRLRWQNYTAIAAMALRGGAERKERLVLELTSNREFDPVLLRRWLEWQRERPVSRLNAWRQLLAAARYQAPAGPPARPVLVLGSRTDRLVDVACSQQLAQAWQLECALHPTAGHDLPLDDGAWVADKVARWLRQ